MITYSELRRELVGMFAAAGIASAAVDSDLLITGLTGLSRPELFLCASEPVPAELERHIRELARRRAHREPLQYLLGVAYFMDLELEVTPAVLIPRPETELLAEFAIRHLPEKGTMLDLGTGSGAIALAVAADRPDAHITAVDISSDALAVARRNRDRCGGEVRFLQSDLFSGLGEERFDLVGANLPYVTPEEYPALEPEVRLFEPQLALTAEDGGFRLIERAARELPSRLNPGGRAIFELSPPQAPRLAGLFAELGVFDEIAVIADYTHRDRFVSARIAIRQ